jgi:hypothetical protein
VNLLQEHTHTARVVSQPASPSPPVRHTWMAPSQPPDVKCPPPGAAASAATESPCPLYTATSVAASAELCVAPSASCHRRAVPSCPVLATGPNGLTSKEGAVAASETGRLLSSVQVTGACRAAEWLLCSDNAVGSGRGKRCLGSASPPWCFRLHQLRSGPTCCERQPLRLIGRPAQRRDRRHALLVRCKGACWLASTCEPNNPLEPPPYHPAILLQTIFSITLELSQPASHSV